MTHPLIESNLTPAWIRDINSTLFQHLGQHIYRHGLDIVTLDEIIEHNEGEPLVVDDESVIEYTHAHLLDERYYLIYIDRNDQLYPEEINALINDPAHNYYESDTAENYAITRAETCNDETNTVIEEIEDLLTHLGVSTDVLNSTYDHASNNLVITNETLELSTSRVEDVVRDTIYERDQSDELKDLLNNTPSLFARIVVTWPFDDVSFDVPEADLIQKLHVILGWQYTNSESQKKIEEQFDTWVNTMHHDPLLNVDDYALELLFRLDPSDIANLSFDEPHVKITGVYPGLIQPFEGVVAEPWDDLIAFEEPLIVHRSRIFIDDQGPGYGFDDSVNLSRDIVKDSATLESVHLDHEPINNFIVTPLSKHIR